MKALIVVDAQYDFMPVSTEDYEKGMGGALAVKDGDQIVPIINELLPRYDLIIFTKDWHKPNNIYFADSHKQKKVFDQLELNGKTETLWPVHCVQGTRGADFHDEIDFNLIKGEFFIIKKGLGKDCHPYGAFGDEMEDTGLEELLDSKGVEEIDVVGLALDYCVKDTAIVGAKKYKTTIFIEGTRAINPDINELLLEFDEAGVVVEELHSEYYGIC